MAAGLSHWEFGRFDLYRVNPPLVRTLAVIPVVAAGYEMDWKSYSAEPGHRSEFGLGAEFIRLNGDRSIWLFTLARWVCIPFSVLGALICYRSAFDLYGQWAAFLALSLWCFCPNILAHGQMITPDVGATSLGIAASYAYWRWLRSSSWTAALTAGVLLALACLCKSTWLILFVLWPGMWMVMAASGMSKPLRASDLRQRLTQLSVVVLVGLYLTNLGYGFEGSLQQLGQFDFISDALSGEGNACAIPGNRFRENNLAALPVPLPANYLLGVDHIKWEFEQKKLSYLLGETQLGGWWYYYLYALLVKLPLGTWLLFAVALIGWQRYGAGWRNEGLLVVTPLLILAAASAQTGFSHHLRYVLPIFPFAFILISRVARSIEFRHWAVIPLVVGGALWSVCSSLSVFPHSLSYFNECAGGPERGHEHLIDSNIDWGQDLLFLKDWLNDHPEAKPLYVRYFGAFKPASLGIESFPVPKDPSAQRTPIELETQPIGPVPGRHAISVHDLRLTGNYEYFQYFAPVARAGYSIYIYDISADEANRVRKLLGLPTLDETRLNASSNPHYER